VGVGAGVPVGNGVGVGSGVGVFSGVGVGSGVGSGAGVASGVGSGVGVSAVVGVGSGVGVSSGESVGSGVGVAAAIALIGRCRNSKIVSSNESEYVFLPILVLQDVHHLTCVKVEPARHILTLDYCIPRFAQERAAQSHRASLRYSFLVSLFAHNLVGKNN